MAMVGGVLLGPGRLNILGMRKWPCGPPVGVQPASSAPHHLHRTSTLCLTVSRAAAAAAAAATATMGTTGHSPSLDSSCAHRGSLLGQPDATLMALVPGGQIAVMLPL